MVDYEEDGFVFVEAFEFVGRGWVGCVGHCGGWVLGGGWVYEVLLTGWKDADGVEGETYLLGSE